MIRISILPVFMALLLFSQTYAATDSPQSNRRSGTDYLSRLSPDTELIPNSLIIKFKAETRGSLSKQSVSLQAVLPAFAEIGVYETIQMYPDHGNSFTAEGRDIGMDRMYRISYAENIDPLTAARKISGIYGVEYAEPERIHHLVYTPDDPMLTSQYALAVMKVYDAWDITTGSEDVVIGIVDSGVHYTHQDIQNNLWINPGEDINDDGKFTIVDLNDTDDDNNGYVDDIVGIDFVGPTFSEGGTYYDNDPRPTILGNNHGTHVAGISAAVADNGKGIAGVAYGCRIMPVKCGTDNGGQSILRGYDGIAYAADNGAKVINCSWGGKGGYLQNEEDRIDYAVSKGAVVVGATGNDGLETIFTPASYPNVLSVASTNATDGISGYSNYGTWVDVSAPGSAIVSAVSRSNSSYSTFSGTSMAAPQVAGILALLASHRTDLTPRQLAEQVRVSSENIDGHQASRYHGKVGFGRVNALRALTITSPAVSLISASHDDSKLGNGNGILDRGETFELRMRWKNYLAPTKNALIKLSSDNPRITIDNPDLPVGVLGTGDEIGNENDPFVIHIANEIAYNDEIVLKYSVTDGEYKDFGAVSYFQQPTYRDHNVNKIITTISNDGNIGFDDFSGLRGSGFTFERNNFNVLFEGALMIGATINRTELVVDVARDNGGQQQEDDLFGSAPVLMLTPGPVASQEGFTEFSDDNAPLRNLIGLNVNLHTYAFTDPGIDNVVFLKYDIRNKSQNVQEDLHVGLFFDWDISTNASGDLSDYDTTSLTGYVVDRQSGVPTVVGATVLSREKPVHFMSINNSDGSGNPPVFGIYDGFTKEEKYVSMSSGILQKRSNIDDVSQVYGNGPFTLNPGDSITVGFALIAGLSKDDILKTTPKALDKWDEIIGASTGIGRRGAGPDRMNVQAFPNPVPSSSFRGTTLRYELRKRSEVRIDVFDGLGRNVISMSAGEQGAGTNYHRLDLSDLGPGTWLVRLSNEEEVSVSRLVILR